MKLKKCKFCEKEVEAISFEFHDCVKPFDNETRQKLERLWFIYGNNGPKCTMDNHKYIQRLVEGRRKDANFYKPDKECQKAVKEIIENK